MTVYVDNMKRPARVRGRFSEWSHLMADSTEELQAFGDRLGLRRTWLQLGGTALEHYDLTEARRTVALRMGAVPIGYPHESAALVKAKRHGARFDLDAFRAEGAKP
jgi:hypothetical protein